MANGHTVTLEWIKLILPLIVVLATVVSFAVGLQSQLNYLDARLCVIEEDRRADLALSRSIEVRLAEIQRDISYIRKEMDNKE